MIQRRFDLSETTSTNKDLEWCSAYQELTERAPLLNLFQRGRQPDNPTFLDSGCTVSWETFSAAVGGLASELAERSEKYWLICSTRPMQMATALFATWVAGKTPVFPPNFLPDTIARLEVVEGILADESMQFGRQPSININHVSPGPSPALPISPSLTAIFYTSGSTGIPKRIDKPIEEIQHEQYLPLLLWEERLVGKLIVSTIPPYHGFGAWYRILLPLIAGACIENEWYDENRAIDDTHRKGYPSVLVSSPAFLGRLPLLVREGRRGDPAIEMIFSSGSALDAATAKGIHALFGIGVTELYGSTETGPIAWRQQPVLEHWSSMPTINIRASEEGTLQIRSPYIRAGAWLAVPDLVEFVDGKQFILKGRADRVIKFEERRISLTEMEGHLQSNPAVARAILASLELEGVDRSIMGAVIMLSEHGKMLLAEMGSPTFNRMLKQHLATRFEAPVLPRQFRYVDRFPENELGKCTVQSIQELFRPNVKDQTVMPTNEHVRLSETELSNDASGMGHDFKLS